MEGRKMDTREQICQAIDSCRERVISLSHELHEHPELKFQEHFACDLLTRALRERGLGVEVSLAGLDTSFRCAFGNSGPTIAILAEYDALPNGHSCGHNLIAGAALREVAGLSYIAERWPSRAAIMR